MISSGLWNLQAQGEVTHVLFIGFFLTQTKWFCPIWVLAVSADKMTYIFICQSICDCAPKRISSLNKMVPSSSLCFDKDFMWQVMSEVHLSVCKADANAWEASPPLLSRAEVAVWFLDDLYWGWAAATDREAGWLSSQVKGWDFGIKANKVVHKAAPCTALLVKNYLGCIHTSVLEKSTKLRSCCTDFKVVFGNKLVKI